MKISICTGTKCMFYGADNIIDCLTDLQEHLAEYHQIPEDAVLELELVTCDGSCKGKGKKIAPLVYIDGDRFERTSSPEVMEEVFKRLQVNE